LVPRSKHASRSATHIGTPVLLTQQYEVRNCRRRHCEFSTSNPTNSSGQAGLSNNPRHPEVTAGNDTHLGGGTLGHLGHIVSDASYAMISPAIEAGPTLWVSPTAPGRDPSNTDGTSAHISAARHIWEEEVQTYRTYTSVQQALKNQIINVFEPM
jgi:hypothetical protein